VCKCLSTKKGRKSIHTLQKWPLFLSSTILTLIYWTYNLPRPCFAEFFWAKYNSKIRSNIQDHCWQNWSSADVSRGHDISRRQFYNLKIIRKIKFRHFVSRRYLEMFLRRFSLSLACVRWNHSASNSISMSHWRQVLSSLQIFRQMFSRSNLHHAIHMMTSLSSSLVWWSPQNLVNSKIYGVSYYRVLFSVLSLPPLR
jgi:hypothetical protein